MNGGTETSIHPPRMSLRAFVSGGLESVAACGAVAGAVAAGAPGAAGAAAAAALAAASGWAWMEAEAAPASHSHGPWAESASLAPPLQQHKDPTVRHAPRSQKDTEMSLAQARKSQMLVFNLPLSGVPAVPAKITSACTCQANMKAFGSLAEVKVAGALGAALPCLLGEPALSGRPQ